MDISPGEDPVVCEERRAPAMPLLELCLIRSGCPAGGPPVRLGVPLLDEYLRFVAGRCRPNTVLAAAYDLKVFFTVVGKQIAEVQRGDALHWQRGHLHPRPGAQCQRIRRALGWHGPPRMPRPAADRRPPAACPRPPDLC